MNNSTGEVTSKEKCTVQEGWDLSFDDLTSTLSVKNGPVTMNGKLNFISDGSTWTLVKSRDGVSDRFAIVDMDGNVQGYFVVSDNGEELELLFYHRTAQSYKGMMSLTGRIEFYADSFTCRTTAGKGEQVLPLSYGFTDSSLNDSIFAPGTDTALRFQAASIKIGSLEPGIFSFVLSGSIQESSEALFGIMLCRDYFKKRYVPYYHAIDRARCPKTPTGWMSWNTYFDRATADDNLAEARTGQKYLQPFGCEIWSIESWQENSDKLPVSDFFNMNLETSKRKFPEGMKKLAQDIKNLGFRPGIWMAPFGTGNKEFYDLHRDWFLHDKDGNPISCWNGKYTLDPTVIEAREHLKEIFRKASREWGYEYFKIDGMSGRSQGYCAHLYERPEIRAQFKDPSCTNPFELCIKAFREGIGEDRIILACQGHTTGPEVFYADASRIGADIVAPDQPVKWEGVHNQGRCFINQAFTHNIVMFADPDTLLVHDLSSEEARVSATIVALPGQFTFFGDKLAQLSEEKMKLLQQTLPAINVHPVNLFPVFSMLPVWNLRVKNSLLDQYNIVALFNWDDDDNRISFTTMELGIDSEAVYTVFEFWTRTDHGCMKDKFTMDVPSHSVRLLAIHKLSKFPQWISSDRHVSQVALELKEHKWIEKKRSLEGMVELISIFPLTMYIRVPEGYKYTSLTCDEADHMADIGPDNILAVTFKPKRTGEYRFSINFR